MATEATSAPMSTATDNTKAASEAASQFLVAPKNKAARNFVEKLRFNETADLGNEAYTVGIFTENQKNDIIGSDTFMEKLIETLDGFMEQSGSVDGMNYKFKDPFPSRLQDRVIQVLAAVVDRYGTNLVSDAINIAVENVASAPTSNKNLRFDVSSVLAALDLNAHSLLAVAKEEAEAHLRTRKTALSSKDSTGSGDNNEANADDDADGDVVETITKQLGSTHLSNSFDTTTHIREFIRKKLPQGDKKWMVISDATETLLFLLNNLHHRILSGANILARLASRTTIHKSDVVFTAAMMLSNNYSMDPKTALHTVNQIVEAYGSGPHKAARAKTDNETTNTNAAVDKAAITSDASSAPPVKKATKAVKAAKADAPVVKLPAVPKIRKEQKRSLPKAP